MNVFQTTPGGIVLSIAGLPVYIALVAWARRPGHVDRLPVLAAATCMGFVTAGMNILAAAIGWWGGHWSYALAIPLQISFWVLWITPLMALLLAGYRWLAAHMRRPRLVYGLVLLVLLAPFTVIVDTWALDTGRLSMGGGYAIWHDVLLGQALLWLAVFLYEVARRRWHIPAGV